MDGNMVLPRIRDILPEYFPPPACDDEGPAAETAAPQPSGAGALRGTRLRVRRRKFACTICAMDFERPSSLEVHMRSHTGEKPFLCPYPGCTKRYQTNSNLTRHRKRHRDDDGCRAGNVVPTGNTEQRLGD